MKHSGKLPRAVVGELQHVLNNALASIIFRANQIEGNVNAAIIEKQAFEMAGYIKSLGEKTEWNSTPFAVEESDDKAA